MDEILTLDIGLSKRTDYFFSLIYLSTTYFYKLFGASELTTRLPAALCGIFSVPVFFLTCKKFFGERAAFIGTIFLLFSPYHLDQSQYARFYSATFLFGTLAYFFYFQYVKTKELKTLVLALITTVTGIAVHPTFVFLPVAVWLFTICALSLKQFNIDQKTVLALKHIAIALTAVGLFLVMPYALYIFKASSSYMGGTDFEIGYPPIKIVLQYIKYFNLSLVSASVLGLICLYRQNSLLSAFYAFSIMFPIVILTALGGVFDVGPSFAMFVYPQIIMLAGYFAAQLYERIDAPRLFATGIIIIILVGLLPEFLSHYTDKKTYDIKGAIRFVENSLRNKDKVISLIPSFNYYLDDTYDRHLEPFLYKAGNLTLEDKLERYAEDRSRVWVIVENTRGQIHWQLKQWLQENFKLVWEKPTQRFDYTYRAIRIYLKD